MEIIIENHNQSKFRDMEPSPKGCIYSTIPTSKVQRSLQKGLRDFKNQRNAEVAVRLSLLGESETISINFHHHDWANMRLTRTIPTDMVTWMGGKLKRPQLPPEVTWDCSPFHSIPQKKRERIGNGVCLFSSGLFVFVTAVIVVVFQCIAYLFLKWRDKS